MRCVVASIAGIALTKISVIGKSIHCNSIIRYLCVGCESGRFGKSGILNVADNIIPIMDSVMRLLNICGALKKNALSRTDPDATHIGSRPTIVIMTATKHQDHLPSHSTNIHLNFFQNGIRLPFLLNSQSKNGTCSTPHAQRRCCLYKFFILVIQLSSRTVSMDTGI